MEGSSQAQAPAQAPAQVVVLSREDRVLKYGVDCVGPHDSDGICFSGGEWVPGGEYIKKLRVKNVSTKSVKLKYKLPVSRSA